MNATTKPTTIFCRSLARWIVAAAFLVLALPTLCSAEETRFAKTEIHMAVDVEIVVYAENQAAADKAFQAGFARIAELNKKLSDYDADSEVSQLSNSAGSSTAVRLSDDLFAVLKASQELSRASGGAFDATVGPFTKLWRRARRQKELPSAERIAEAREATGFAHLKLNESERTATLLKPGMRIDLGGIAKGFAVDEALKAIRQTGITKALVRASGDIVAGDAPPGQPGWIVGLAPLDPDEEPSVFIALLNNAVSTSGDSRQHLIVDGRRYSHLIDPRSGSPVEGRSAVSVIAPTGMQADSLASAVSVLGPKEGLRLIERTEKAAMRGIWETSPTEPLTIVESARFPTYLMKP